MSWQNDFITDFVLSPFQISSFELLLEMLREHSERNLTAVTSPENIVRFHFRDSLSLLSFPELVEAGRLADIGSGAGFPGLPLAICRPDLDLTLIESNRKKAEFIAEFIARSGLTNAIALALRAEIAGASNLRESFDIALARAVGSISLSMEYASPLLKSGGHLLLQRGESLPGDDQKAASAGSALALRLMRVTTVSPFPEARNLNVWVFKKTGPTPDRFPRKPGIPKKRPL